jgi:hypothetical protein
MRWEESMTARSALLAALVLFWHAGAVCAQARDMLEERSGFLECGNVRISARAVCHAGTPLCASQTFTFSGASGRATLAPHFHKSAYRHGDRVVDVLDYHAVSWACTAGSRSGRYLVVGLQRAGGAVCTECDYEQVYNLSGRLLVSGMTVDADGRARENREGRLFIAKLKSGLHPKQFRPVFRN